MKKGMLLLMLAGSVYVQAQTLKEALYSGKLKNESGTVIRKGEDLSSKIDTAQHKPATDETGKTAPKRVTTDSTKSAASQMDAAVTPTADQTNPTSGATETAAPEATAPAEAAAAPKSNNALLKVYMDSVASALKSDVLSSKKIKRGSYYVLVTYAIETDGQVSFSDVFLSPENSFLQQQIKDRLSLETPRLSPVLNSAGAPRKVIKKYNFTVTKE